MLDSVLPAVRLFKALQDNEEHTYPHVWTDNKQFQLEILLPEFNSVRLKLQGLIRNKYTEHKYGKDINTPVELQDTVDIATSVLTIANLEGNYNRSEIAQENTNEFVVKTNTAAEENILGLQLSLSRNHWDKRSKAKFMMFVLSVVYDNTVAVVRVYAQTNVPHDLKQVEIKSEIPLTNKSDNSNKVEKRKLDEILFSLEESDLLRSSNSSLLEEIEDSSLYAQTLKELETTVMGSAQSSPLRSDDFQLLSDIPADLLELPQEVVASFVDANPLALLSTETLDDLKHDTKRQRLSTDQSVLIL